MAKVRGVPPGFYAPLNHSHRQGQWCQPEPWITVCGQPPYPPPFPHLPDLITLALLIRSYQMKVACCVHTQECRVLVFTRKPYCSITRKKVDAVWTVTDCTLKTLMCCSTVKHLTF